MSDLTEKYFGLRLRREWLTRTRLDELDWQRKERKWGEEDLNFSHGLQRQQWLSFKNQ